MTSNGIFLSEEEYKADIYELFKQFDFDTQVKLAAGEEVPLEDQLLDISTLKLIFKALQKPLQQVTVNKIEKECAKNNQSGVSYAEFERLYLTYFPYKNESLLDEAFSMFDKKGTGVITIDDMKRVVKEINSSFTDDDLAFIMKTLGKDGNISIDAVRRLFC